MVIAVNREISEDGRNLGSREFSLLPEWRILLKIDGSEEITAR
jgi:hypothetical protein